MYAHERSLVEKYKGRPFVILGVNSDADRDQIKQVAVRDHLVWRSWWAGGIDGPIPRQYRVTGWPTLYLLDAQGVIRHAQLQGPALDGAIEALVRETESAPRK